MATSPDILTAANGQPSVTVEERHGDDCTCKAAADPVQ